MARGGDFDLELVKEEPPDEQGIKVEVDIEEHDLLQQQRLRAAEVQHHPEQSSVKVETAALPDTGTGRTAPGILIKFELESPSEESCSDGSGEEVEHSVDVPAEPPGGAGDAAREKSFKCNLCEYRSIQKVCLKKHMIRHSLYIRQHLNAHMRTHTAENNKRYNLNQHIKTHTNEKPLKCNLCEYATRARGHLNAHMRTHTGEKPFQCQICDYKCSKRFNLNQHIKSHTKNKCNVCELAFSRSRSLVAHVKRNHSEIVKMVHD